MRNPMETTQDSLIARARGIAGELVTLRRDIHRNPELGFAEHRTAAVVASRMEALGARVRTKVGRTGVVAELGQGHPVVAVRADMDALAIQEATGLPFASCVPGAMHACGHDAHVACAIGAAMLLAGGPLRGTVRFLFQPSEEQKDGEGWSGAMRMIEEGALENVRAAIALHTRGLRAGQIGVIDGPALAGNDTLRVTIRGRAAHAAHPEEGVDAIAIAAHIVLAAQQIVSRRTRAGVPVVVSLTTIQGGVKENVLAEHVEIGGTLRHAGPDERTRLIEEFERALDVGRALGGDCSVEIQEGYPVTRNDPRVAAAIRSAARDLLGAGNVVEVPFDTWAEDFGYIAARVPAAMFFLGVSSERLPAPVWHSPRFDLDEEALPIGAAVLAGAARRLTEA
jgi:amidohydrolase